MGTRDYARRLKKFFMKHFQSSSASVRSPGNMVVTAVIIGAGSRGRNYGHYALEFPDQLKIVGVAEPREITREKFQKNHGLSDDRVYNTWEDVAAVEKFADCAIITTQDQMHKAPSVALAEKGYHVLLEKPMAVTYEDCKEIVETCKKNSAFLAVCHVLRYSPQARKIKSIIESGSIGEVMNIQHLEPVGNWHFAHSYVIGNWANEERSSFSLLAKCCHDIDLIDYWMGDTKCKMVSSMGSLQHFTSSKKPKGATSRCLDCPVEATCPYSAKRIYLEPARGGHTGWPVSVISEVVDIENITQALRTGPYGRCVYESDNNVMDNQVVLLQYENGATCSMSMVACTEKICARQVRVFGSMGELTCDFDGMFVKEYNFLTKEHINHNVFEELRENKTAMTGHGGADFFAMRAFVKAVAASDASHIQTGPEESLRSHFLCFEAEKSRVNKTVINL